MKSVVQWAPRDRHRPSAVCETCKRLFFGLAPRKFCDVPRCGGYLRHV